MSALAEEQFELPKPGDVIAGKYRIERLIGRGGMGAVFSVTHETLAERVAIKFLLPTVADPTAVARFTNEARNVFKIHGEHVCRVLDVNVSNGVPFIVMELLQGVDLAQLLEQHGRMTIEQSVDYVLQALEAIAQAHALGIVHRDLKPANLFLHQRQDGSHIIKVLDFGVAKASPLDSVHNQSLTSAEMLIGSPLYVSPEQLRSAKSVDARADIWAIGVILYELITGVMPFVGDTLGAIFVAILQTPVVAPSKVRSDVPQALSDAIERCLCRNIDDRFANVGELAQAISVFAPPHCQESVREIMRALSIRSPPIARPTAMHDALLEKSGARLATLATQATHDGKTIDPQLLVDAGRPNEHTRVLVPAGLAQRNSRAPMALAFAVGVVVVAGAMVIAIVQGRRAADDASATTAPIAGLPMSNSPSATTVRPNPSSPSATALASAPPATAATATSAASSSAQHRLVGVPTPSATFDPLSLAHHNYN